MTITSEGFQTSSPGAPWSEAESALRAEFPNASTGILFCVHKLRQDRHLTIPDFRGEADLYGIALGGRALHSARVLLGLAQASVRRSPSRESPSRESPARESPARESNAGEQPPRRKRRERVVNGLSSAEDLEGQLIQALTSIQEKASAESQRLRAAMRKAVDILRAALDD